ncbi:hypothetical protein Tco_0346924, partial [Tanacetum coccineum]
NSSGGSLHVVNDVMDSGPSTDLFVDPKVVEGFDEPVPDILPNVKVRTILKSFTRVVTNEAATSKINFISLDSDKPINTKADVKIPNAFILDVHLRFGFSIYGYFVGKRVAFPVVEYYVKMHGRSLN